MTETELKFVLDPEAHGALSRSAALGAAHAVRIPLVSLYFDTPDCQLAKRAMALRLRRSGRRWVQSLKAGGAARGALHSRNEWEYSRRGPQLDLSLFAQTPLAQLEGAETLHERLALAFRVRVMRTVWRIAPAPGSRLEVALDSGTVESAARSAPISELEIECLEGDVAPAFDLAARLLEEVALRPSSITKAQRGYRLFRAERLRPAKARAPRLDPAMTPLAAAIAVVGADLEQLQANEEGVLVSTEVEFVHQARVALRRMRSALRMFRDVAGTERTQGWRNDLGEVGRALGVARDWDVFATESLPAATAAYGDAKFARALLARAAKSRRRERETARGALRSPRYARVILDIGRWMVHPQ
ncbi:MAG TPA: CYTH and CHAD domain-containing protein, partial [Usitatibacter sp.]|nr:CYTH and CHAD domain-containing protein [Usitatibacter sp.]